MAKIIKKTKKSAQEADKLAAKKNRKRKLRLAKEREEKAKKEELVIKKKKDHDVVRGSKVKYNKKNDSEFHAKLTTKIACGEIEIDDEDEAEEDNVRKVRESELRSVDPGPTKDEVAFGFNCGSCTKFVHLEDPRREDGEWLTKMSMKKPKHRCPFLFPDEIKLGEEESINDYVARANNTACDQFQPNLEAAPPEVGSLLDRLRQEDLDVLKVVRFVIGDIEVNKKLEARNGYKIGESLELSDADGNKMRCRVVAFQSRKGEEVVVERLGGNRKRFTIPARKVRVLD